MAEGTTATNRNRAFGRGALLGVVVAAHVALLAYIMLPAAPASMQRSRRTAPRAGDVLRVRLLPRPLPASQRSVASTPAPRMPIVPPPRARAIATAHRRALARAHRRHRYLTLTLGRSASVAPAYVAGGNLSQRLRTYHRAPAVPKLPGGHQYTAQRLQFIPLKQLSLEGKVHTVGAFLFGWYNPVCENARYELAKPRWQQLRDGYTMRQLERRLREHHCG